MSTDPRALDALYQQVPAVEDCRGLCHDSCTGIAMTPLEQTRLASRGFDLPLDRRGTGRSTSA